MGLSSSKYSAPDAQPPSFSSGTVAKRNRSTKSRLLKSSCLRSYRSDNDESQVSECPGRENGNTVSCTTKKKTGSCDVLCKCCMSCKAEQTDQTISVTSERELDVWSESSFPNSVSRERNNASRSFSNGSFNPLSRLSCYPGSFSFRLSRAKSLSSSNTYLTSAASNTNLNGEEQIAASISSTSVNRHSRPQGCDVYPFRMQHGHCTSNHSNFDPSSPECSDILHDNQQINAMHDMAIDRENTRIDCAVDLFSTINICNSDGNGVRQTNRLIAARERIERNVRFSRTLSVGRLRERVLRRSLVSDFDLYPFSQERDVRQVSRVRDVVSDGNDYSRSVSSGGALSSVPISFYGSQNREVETVRSRDNHYQDLMEHQLNFLERRRRIRSQVRVLQQLRNRIGNFSGHERSCILSGQHLAGHCTCRIAAREVNLADDSTARSSISRVGMLAEALFEVLDEIHQQSVALSTRNSASSVASIPAPNEVVESLPLKILSKLKKRPSEEAPQCYICLTEYEEGDCTRILPCHHEFHRTCVDKWLKEIHRVCPLCRGDICRPGSSTTGS